MDEENAKRLSLQKEIVDLAYRQLMSEKKTSDNAVITKILEMVKKQYDI